MLELLGRGTPDWKAYLALATPAETTALLRRHGRTGRPLGDAEFVRKIEKRLGRVLHPRKPGRKPKKRRGGRRK
jgi:putative transposase